MHFLIPVKTASKTRGEDAEGDGQARDGGVRGTRVVGPRQPQGQVGPKVSQSGADCDQ